MGDLVGALVVAVRRDDAEPGHRRVVDREHDGQRLLVHLDRRQRPGVGGIGEGFARNFAAVTVLGLLVATLEAGLRIVKQSLVELGQYYGITALARAPAGTGLTVGAVLLAALWLAHSAGHGASAWWPLLGLGNQVFACLGLLLFAFALRQRRRPQALVLTPLLGLVAITLWAGWELLILGWRNGEGGVFVAALGLMALEITILLKALIALKKAPLPAPNT